jgi:hypothetical protein
MKKPTHIASTFYFLPMHNANAEKNKKSLQSPTQEEIQIIFSPTLRFLNYLFFPRRVRNRTDIASNANRFVESVCGHELNRFVGTVAHAANIRLKEILKRRALFGNQTVELLTSSGALTNSGASNPFFLKLL